MVEATPARPYGSYTTDLAQVEVNMRTRYGNVASHAWADMYYLNIVYLVCRALVIFLAHLFTCFAILVMWSALPPSCFPHAGPRRSRRLIEHVLTPDERYLTMAIFPTMGVGNFTNRPYPLFGAAALRYRVSH